MVQEPPGTKHERRLYPDSAAWFIVLEGQIRVRGRKARPHLRDYQCDERLVCVRARADAALVEVVGGAPAIRYEVTSGPSSTPVYEKKPSEAPKGTAVYSRHA